MRDDTTGEGRGGRKSGRLRSISRALGGMPLPSVGRDQITHGAEVIRDLAAVLRNSPGPETRLKVDHSGRLDMEATAFSYGMSVHELVELIHRRRSDTARAAYIFLALAITLFGAWIWNALTIHSPIGRIVSAIEYAPFWAACLLLAFRSSYLNWQMRERRLGGPVDYLKTTGRFLPG